MMEATFPLLGTLFVVLIVLPTFALFAKMGLLMLERDAVGGPLHGLNLRYTLLVGSSLLPLGWLFSASLRQVQTGRSSLGCLLDHDNAELCFEPGYFAFVLLIAVLVSSVGALRRYRAARVSSSESARVLMDRVARLIRLHPNLQSFSDRIVVTDDEGFALGAHGWLKPRIFIGVAFAARLSDEMLASALGHEAEHVRDFDPLRYFLLQVTLAVNPMGRFLLEPHAARWQAAREAHCDREAVIRGAAPLPLADAIVRAARPAREAVALGASDTAVLKFRVGMLFAFAERPPVRCCHGGPSTFSAVFFLVLIAFLLPLQTGTAALDALHAGAEHPLTYFLR